MADLFTSKEYNDICTTARIGHTYSAAYTPSQNGSAERTWRTLMERTRCMLTEARLPAQFWEFAMKSATFLNNRTPAQNLMWSTPFQRWSGLTPDLKGIRVFGCVGHVLNEGTHLPKLTSRTWTGIHVGYNGNEYTMWDPATKRTCKSRNVTFRENVFLGNVSHDGSMTVPVAPVAPPVVIPRPRMETEDVLGFRAEGGDEGKAHDDEDEEYLVQRDAQDRQEEASEERSELHDEALEHSEIQLSQHELQLPEQLELQQPTIQVENAKSHQDGDHF
eukprot:c20530_g1_i2.p1 GENE.c20530_g1_i2~~c20530_g1_i2.p1  ORF type:complete len:276 (+),score=32.61 c20530_g1_i2:371-1198(+)